MNSNVKEETVFQSIPLFFLCKKDIKTKAEELKNKINIRIFNKIDKRQIAVLHDAKF
jgi:hypothetical protein